MRCVIGKGVTYQKAPIGSEFNFAAAASSIFYCYCTGVYVGTPANGNGQTSRTDYFRWELYTDWAQVGVKK